MNPTQQRLADLFRKRWAGDITSDEQDELDTLCERLRQSEEVTLVESLVTHARERLKTEAHVPHAGLDAADAFFGIFGMTRAGES